MIIGNLIGVNVPIMLLIMAYWQNSALKFANNFIFE